VGIVQGARHCSHNGYDNRNRHACRKPLAHKLGQVSSVDVVHRDPEMAVVCSPVAYPHDVGMAKSGGEVGLTDKPLPKGRVAG
jgi:hypothetical protein